MARKRPTGSAAGQTVTEVVRPDGTIERTYSQPTDAVDTGFQRDTLEMEQLRKISLRVAAVLGQNPEIMNVFEKAFSGGYDGQGGKDRFWNDIERTQFWQNNSQDLREYIVLSADPNNPDYKIKQEQAQEAIRRKAMEAGLELDPATIVELGDEYLAGGWGKPENAFRIDQRLGQGQFKPSGAGVYQKVATNLRALAQANGVAYNENWFDSAARSVASNASTADFWETKIREQAASTFPVFADQIKAGVNAMDIAEPYMRLMTEYWEENPYDISLSNPTLLKGMTGFDDKGNPRAMNLGEFAQMLRDDPRYISSSKGKNRMAQVGNKILETFGIVGGAR